MVNASAWPRTVVTESSAPDVDIAPAALSLEPHGRGRVVVTRPRPPDSAAPTGALIRVRGAHEYQLDWVLDHGPPAKHPPRVCITDAPVLVHTWSDHFSGFAPR